MKPLEARSRIDDLPLHYQGPVLACARGEIAANIALMHLCMAAPDAAEMDRVFALLDADAPNEPALAALVQLWRGTPQAYQIVHDILGAVDHQTPAVSAEAQLAKLAAGFDRAAGLSPEASVALYSLGSPELLAGATCEIVQKMRGWGLLGPQKTVLEIGCGNGRFVEAIAPEAGHITGIDISAAMVEAARRRCAHRSKITLLQTDGADLRIFADASLDLVFGVDSFPYIVQCGPELALRHFKEAARVLKPQGRLLILNYSYRGDLDADRADVASLGRGAGFAVLREGVRDLGLWDGVTFLLQKHSD